MIWSSKEKGVWQVARVLLIEDNNDIQEILYSLLSEEYEVLQAFSGTEGLRLFQQESVDLVLLDIMLPGKMVIRSWRRSVCRVKCRSS